MRGIDISHWQGKINWQKVAKTDVSFAIMKATQGTSFVDKMFAYNKAQARENGILCGYYHFADGTDAKKEADHFIKTIGDIKKGEIVVLDWEILHRNPVDWCYEWLVYVEKKLGFKPMIYLNLSTVKSLDWSKVVANNTGLWIARYGNNDDIAEAWEKPSSGQWPFWAIWQYSSRGHISGISGYVDLNYTSMDVETLKKYGKQTDDEIDESTSTHGKLIYLKQGDPKWAKVTIGNTPYTLEKYGCTITALSMLTYWYGEYITPAKLAKLLKFNDNGELLWKSINDVCPFDFVYRYYGIDKNKLLDILFSDDNAAIVRVPLGRARAAHWLTLIGYDQSKGFRCIDPLRGDICYTSRYGVINGFAEVRRK